MELSSSVSVVINWSRIQCAPMKCTPPGVKGVVLLADEMYSPGSSEKKRVGVIIIGRLLHPRIIQSRCKHDHVTADLDWGGFHSV